MDALTLLIAFAGGIPGGIALGWIFAMRRTDHRVRAATNDAWRMARTYFSHTDH